MTTRNLIEITKLRKQAVSIAKDTLEVCKNKKYLTPFGKEIDISNTINKSLTNTILYKSDHQFNQINTTIVPQIEVVNETTTNAASRLIQNGRTNIAALNFAAGTNPGGGFLSGSLAQEEDLCRKSFLYPCLKSKPMFYNENILCNDQYYTHNIIYSPDVGFFRDEHNLYLENLFNLSIITSPAPNLNGIEINGSENEIKTIIQERITRILEIAAYHNHKTIILGAWGCGAFCNDPIMVAEAFKMALQKISVFENVCFAVYDKREPPIVYETFKKILN